MVKNDFTFLNQNFNHYLCLLCVYKGRVEGRMGPYCMVIAQSHIQLVAVQLPVLIMAGIPRDYNIKICCIYNIIICESFLLMCSVQSLAKMHGKKHGTDTSQKTVRQKVHQHPAEYKTWQVSRSCGTYTAVIYI